MNPRKLPLVAVVGRPNVGKSTFFNRVIPRGDAVVDDMPGVTRDRREGLGDWNGVHFRVVDTGGLVPGTDDSMEAAILRQGDWALKDADAIVFMVDAREGLTAIDEAIADRLRPYVAKVILAANKVEGSLQELAVAEMSALGFGPALSISAQHGRGTGELLDAMVKQFPRREVEVEEDDAIRVALLGKPNVGKSSIANRMLGEERMIVHEVAGTTRDAVDVRFRYDGSEFVLVDTAGLRRRSHVTGVEYYSTLRTQRSLERCDVALLILDATQTISSQDARIAGMISDAGKSVIFVFNKWDLVTKVTGSTAAFTRLVRDRFPLLAGSPVIFVSALTGQRVSRIPEAVRELWVERRRRVSTSRLNDLLKKAIERVQPTGKSGARPLKLYYITQTGDSPPVFTIFVNDPKSVIPAYRRYLLNFFSEQLDMKATPLRLHFRARR